MMGVQGASARLFYDFCLDDHVPSSDHVLRSIDRHLSLDEVRQALNRGGGGGGSIDPELMIRMLIVGYCMGIGRSATCARRLISISPIAGFVGSGWQGPSWPTDRLRRAHHAWLDTAAGARKTHLERCRRSGVVGYNVRLAVDTKHHLIITHEVTNVRTDRSPAWASGQTFRAYRAAC